MSYSKRHSQTASVLVVISLLLYFWPPNNFESNIHSSLLSTNSVLHGQTPSNVKELLVLYYHTRTPCSQSAGLLAVSKSRMGVRAFTSSPVEPALGLRYVYKICPFSLCAICSRWRLKVCDAPSRIWVFSSPQQLWLTPPSPQERASGMQRPGSTTLLL